MKNEHWLEEWASGEVLAEAPAEIERRLVGSLRRRRRIRQSVAVLGALCAAAFVWSSFPLAPPPPPPPVVAAAVPSPVAPLAAAEPVAAAPRKKIPHRKAPARATPPPAAVESNFVAVGAWGAAEPLDRGSIVRVRVPRAALSNYGMPVSAERWNEPARADLLLGEDGTVRAVRLVSASQ